jgi:hypothetical protein
MVELETGKVRCVEWYCPIEGVIPTWGDISRSVVLPLILVLKHYWDASPVER